MPRFKAIIVCFGQEKARQLIIDYFQYFDPDLELAQRFCIDGSLEKMTQLASKLSNVALMKMLAGFFEKHDMTYFVESYLSHDTIENFVTNQINTGTFFRQFPRLRIKIDFYGNEYCIEHCSKLQLFGLSVIDDLDLMAINFQGGHDTYKSRLKLFGLIMKPITDIAGYSKAFKEQFKKHSNLYTGLQIPSGLALDCETLISRAITVWCFETGNTEESVLNSKEQAFRLLKWYAGLIRNSSLTKPKLVLDERDDDVGNLLAIQLVNHLISAHGELDNFSNYTSITLKWPRDKRCQFKGRMEKLLSSQTKLEAFKMPYDNKLPISDSYIPFLSALPTLKESDIWYLGIDESNSQDFIDHFTKFQQLQKLVLRTFGECPEGFATKLLESSNTLRRVTINSKTVTREMDILSALASAPVCSDRLHQALQEWLEVQDANFDKFVRAVTSNQQLVDRLVAIVRCFGNKRAKALCAGCFVYDDPDMVVADKLAINGSLDQMTQLSAKLTALQIAKILKGYLGDHSMQQLDEKYLQPMGIDGFIQGPVLSGAFFEDFPPDDSCAICLEGFGFEQPPVVIQYPSPQEDCLKHRFHEKCILKWAEQQKNCPMCRSQMLPDPAFVPAPYLLPNNRN